MRHLNASKPLNELPCSEIPSDAVIAMRDRSIGDAAAQLEATQISLEAATTPNFSREVSNFIEEQGSSDHAGSDDVVVGIREQAERGSQDEASVSSSFEAESAIDCPAQLHSEGDIDQFRSSESIPRKWVESTTPMVLESESFYGVGEDNSSDVGVSAKRRVMSIRKELGFRARSRSSSPFGCIWEGRPESHLEQTADLARDEDPTTRNETWLRMPGPLTRSRGRAENLDRVQKRPIEYRDRNERKAGV